MPTLFGYGMEDGCVLPAASAEEKKYFSGWYERVALKGVGHYPPGENPKAVVRLFERLLKKAG